MLFDYAHRLNTSMYLIGYDIETQLVDHDEDESKVVSRSKIISHQWYFSFPKYRFGVIFISEKRLTENQLVKFVQEIVPKEVGLKDVYLSAHFSLIEGGWLKPSFVTVASEGKAPYKKPVIGKRGKKWVGKVRLFDRVPDKKKDKKILRPPIEPDEELDEGFEEQADKNVPAKAVKKAPGVWLRFVDTMDLFNGSLKKLGDMIGIPKLEHDSIEHMELLLKTNFTLFCEYGIRDSIITAEAYVYFDREFKKASADDPVKFCTRITQYSEEYFKNFFKRIYGKEEWRSYLGWEQIQIPDKTRRCGYRSEWRLGNGALSFIPFYVGGRNEVSSVGPRKTAIYYDLKSAYPTAILMLPDYDFSCIQVTRGAEADLRINEFMEGGPFQVAGVVCSFRFKDGAQPMFPVRTDLGPVFPKSGFGYIMWPEFWTAKHMDLLESLVVFSFSEFTALRSRNLSDEIAQLLERRKAPALKGTYKNLLNFFYGKTTQGVREVSARVNKRESVGKVPTSSMTCFPLAAYMTSFCRAVIGELHNLNPCYGITTDGFISPEDDLKTGYLTATVQERMNDIGFEFIEVAFAGTESLFIKTRGYLLVNEEGFSEDGNKKEYFKLAMMGISVRDSGLPETDDNAVKFLKLLNAQTFRRSNSPGFNQLRGEIRTSDRETLALLFDAYERVSAVDVEDQLTLEDQIQRSVSREKKIDRFNRMRKDIPPDRVYLNQKINMTFDMKRIPVDPVEGSFTYKDVTVTMPSFETRPLESADDFNLLRRLSHRSMSVAEYRELLKQVKPFGL